MILHPHRFTLLTSYLLLTFRDLYRQTTSQRDMETVTLELKRPYAELLFHVVQTQLKATGSTGLKAILEITEAFEAALGLKEQGEPLSSERKDGEA